MSPRPDSPPDEASLHEAALAYLARYAATTAGVRAVLERRIERWARGVAGREDLAEEVAAAKRAVGSVVARLVAAGAIDDARYAETRARSLTRAGRSRRVVAAQLAAKGVDQGLARAALDDDGETELAAALVLARKRRIGPFRTSATADRPREVGILARAGFPRSVVERALDADVATAECLIRRLREG